MHRGVLGGWRARVVWGSLSAVALALVAPEARAGNAETYYLGSDAALTAGAATATTTGASALWYNPAQLAEGEGDTINLGVSAYLVRFGGTADLEPGTPSIDRKKFDGMAFQSTPTTVAHKLRLFGWDIGVGLFVPNTVLSSPRALAKTTPGSSIQGEIALDASFSRTEYYAGLGFGRQLSSNVRVGAAVFGYYANNQEDVDLGVIADGDFIVDSGGVTENQFGLQAVSGLSWRALPRLRLGLTLRSPVVELFTSGSETELRAEGDRSSGTATVRIESRGLGGQAGILAPARAALGAAIDLGTATTVAVDLRVRGPYSDDHQRVGDPVVDVRAGARTRLARQTWLGGGLFSDRSARPARGGDDSTDDLDYYGATLGVELGRPYRAVNDEGERRRLRFATAFVVSYALGLGRVANLAATDREGALFIEPRRDRAVAHEFMFMIGSSLSNVLSP